MVPLVEQKRKEPVVSVDEYRKILNDYSSPKELIIKRIEYLEAFCRNMIKTELREYDK